MDTKDVTDFTDWNETRVPSLAGLDSALRCQVCKDYFTAPVSTTCGHTFCSLCIRRYLSTTQQCPMCRSKLPDADACLRQNHTVQEILSTFTGARGTLMQELKKAPPLPPLPAVAPSSLGGGDGDRRKSNRRQEVSRGNSSADSEYADSTGSQTRELRRSTRARRTNGSKPQLPPAGVEIIGIDDDEDEIEDDVEEGQVKVRRRKSEKEEVLDNDYDPDNEDADDDVKDEREKENRKEVNDGMVDCPSCSRRVPEGRINIHLDRCLKGIPDDPLSPSKTSLGFSSNLLQKPISSISAFASSSKPKKDLPPAPKEQRLAKLSYGVMKETQLRLKCKDRGIPATGTKQQMEKRYTEWVNIFNANLDSTHPKSKQQLLRDLERWEKQEVMSQAAESRNPFKQEGFSGEKWAEQHDDNYKDLIAKAMAGRKRRKVGEGDGTVGGAAEMQGMEVDEMDLDTSRRKSPSIPTPTVTPNAVTAQTVHSYQAS